MSGSKYQISDQNSTYFVTCTAIHWIDLFTRLDYKNIIVDSLNHCVREKHLVLNAWVLMSNHLHIVGRCDPPGGMSWFLRDFKKFTSKKIIQTMQEINESRKDWLLDKFEFEAKRTRRAENYKIWKDDNHPIDLTDIDPYQKIDYIHNNPVRAGIVDNPEEYIYSSARDYIEKPGLIKVELI